MKYIYPINKAFYHFLSVVIFIFLLIINIYNFICNESNITFRIMIFLIGCISVLITVKTGISLKKSKR